MSISLQANFTKRKSCRKAYHARTQYDVVFLSHCQYHSFRARFLYTVDLHPIQARVMDGKTLHFFPHYQETLFYYEGGQAYENATFHQRFPLEVLPEYHYQPSLGLGGLDLHIALAKECFLVGPVNADVKVKCCKR